MNEPKGSKRCMLKLIDSKDFTSTINVLIKDVGAHISNTDSWLPKGYHDSKEAELKNFLKEHFNPQLATDIKKWWLHATGRTPNWDLISTCTINGERGILLVEAKAHKGELKNEKKGKPFKEDTSSENTKLNHYQITNAINEAKNQLINNFSTVNISVEQCYQLSNRIAHAWWLANQGIPVVLIYLGCLHSEDMSKYKLFNSDEEWETCFKEHCTTVGIESLINTTIPTNKKPFTLICRSIY